MHPDNETRQVFCNRFAVHAPSATPNLTGRRWRPLIQIMSC
jgi:hypothetical protein